MNRQPVAHWLRGKSVVLVLVALLPMMGCGRAKGTVSGKVTYKDKPLAGGFVTFVPQQGGAFRSKIETDGTYTVANIPAGPAKISVQAPEPPKFSGGMIPPSEIDKMAKSGTKIPTKTSGTAVKLPAKYNDPEKSDLTLTVTSGPQTHDIPLK